MGREIRKVPADWQHPRDERGNYVPLYDRAYGPACEEWIARLLAWEGGSEERKEAEKSSYYERYLWDWDGGPPRKDSCRERDWTEAEADHLQVYETVSEGTPISPVLPSREAVAAWLVTQGYSVEAATVFSVQGWAPSMVFAPGKGITMDIESCAPEKL